MKESIDLTGKLMAQGYRLTPQRMMVKSAIHKSDNHNSAEEI